MTVTPFKSLGCTYALLVVALASQNLTGCSTLADQSADIDADAAPALLAVEQLRLGSVDDPIEGFSNIAMVEQDKDGNVFVLDYGEMVIRVLDANGRRVRSIGGRGDGPGEFRIPNNIGILGDTLWVVDQLQYRFTLFTRSGELIGTFPAPRLTYEPLPGISMTVVGTTLRQDRRIEGGVSMVSMSQPEMNADTVPSYHLLFDIDGNILDTISTSYVPAGFPSSRVSVAGVMLTVPTVSDAAWHLRRPNGTLHVNRPVATEAASSTFTLTATAADGDTVFSRAFRYAPRPFPEHWADTLAMRSATRRGATVEMSVLVNGLLEHIDLPAYQPPVSSVRLGADGSIWLAREAAGEETTRWLIVDSTGTARGVVTSRANSTVKWSSGDLYWASELDELGVPWLVKYAIARPGH